MRDEYDFSVSRLEKDRKRFSKEVDALNPLLKEMGGKVEVYAGELSRYLRNSALYGGEQGKFVKSSSGAVVFTHLPGGSIKKPVPPPPLDLKLPPLPTAPVAQLTAQQLRERREALFSELTKGRTTEALVEEARMAFSKRSIDF